MISLNVKDYCQSCPDFEPTVDRDTMRRPIGDGQTLLCADTVVGCRYLERCKHIMRYLENKLYERLAKGDKDDRF